MADSKDVKEVHVLLLLYYIKFSDKLQPQIRKFKDENLKMTPGSSVLYPPLSKLGINLKKQ